MEDENKCCRECMEDFARIERGEVVETDNPQSPTKYKVRSYGRSGITTPWIPAVIGGTRSVGTKVYFFLFDDGSGGIIGNFS